MNTFHKFIRAITKMASGYRPIVICGPSGSGKSTLLNKLMLEYPDKFAFCTSHTTRQPREGEIDGVHYHFVDAETMTKAVNNYEFVEHAVFGGNLYGTSKKALNKVLNEGKIAILDIETQGVRQVKKSEINAHYIFVQPPTLEALKERLKGRKTETEDSMNLRLSHAMAEMEYGTTPGNFDVIIVNDQLERAYAELKAYVEEVVFVVNKV